MLILVYIRHLKLHHSLITVKTYFYWRKTYFDSINPSYWSELITDGSGGWQVFKFCNTVFLPPGVTNRPPTGLLELRLLSKRYI